MNIRIPAGTRLGKKALGGRFVALGDIPTLAAALEGSSRTKLVRRLARETNKVARALDRAVKSEQRAEESGRQFERRRSARKAAQEKARAFRAVQDATRTSTGASDTRRRRESDDAEEAPEWAIGASYVPGAGRGGHHRTSAVDISILVRRSDGRPMPQREAKKVMAYVREHRIVPTDYYLAAIDWRSPNGGSATAREFKGWQTGNVETDFDNFYNILTAISGQPGKWTVKMGGLK